MIKYYRKKGTKEPIKYKKNGEWTPLPSGIEFGTPEFKEWFGKEFKINSETGKEEEEQKMIYVSNGYESFDDCKKSKSIWKDVSELPNDRYVPFIYIRFNTGVVILGRFNGSFCNIEDNHIFPKDIVKEWCYLNDHLSEHEQLKKDVEMLKERK